MRFRFVDLLLFALLFIFINAFPVDLITKDELIRLLIRIGLRLLLLGYDIYIIWRNRINIFKFANYRNVGLFLPFILICFSNIIAASIAGSHFEASVNSEMLSLIIIYFFLGAILEEFLFRFFIQNSLNNVSSVKRIFGSAAIFALFHLINIVNISQVSQLISVLIQVVYAFGLGLLLALVYEYTYSLPACIIFHFLFNFFNTVMVENIFHLAIPDAYYYLTAVVLGVIVGIYALLIYLLVLKRNDRYFRK